MSFKLYELAEMYQNLLDLDLSPEDLESALQNIEGEIEDKIDGIGKVLKEINSEIKIIKEEEDRLRARRKALEKREKDLKDYTKSQLEAIDMKKVKTALFTVSIAKNRKTVNVLDESKIPEDYFKVTRTPIKADILEAYDHGVITEGVEVVQTESLRIR